jgi:hypothetical protein
MTRRFIGYPAGWTLSVIGDAAAADAARAELAEAGVQAEDVILLAGADGADQITRLGTSTGLAARIRRGVQFVTMDQMPDLHVYELAMEQGHRLLGLRVADSEERRSAIEIIKRHGAHFINRFGAWATEEIAPWRGRMPDLPQHMQR